MPARSVQRSRQRLPGQNTCPGILVLREAPGLRHMLVSGSCARLVCVRGPSVCQGNEPLKVAYRLWNLRCRANRRKLETREADPRELDFPYHLRVRVWLLRCLVRFLAVAARKAGRSARGSRPGPAPFYAAGWRARQWQEPHVVPGRNQCEDCRDTWPWGW